MEIPTLGKNCFWSQCKTLDFLPFTCDFCKQIFCKEHFNPTIHECQNVPDNTILEPTIVLKNVECSMDGCSTMDSVKIVCEKCENHFCLAHRHHGCFDFTEEQRAEAREKLSRPREEFAKSLQKVNEKIDENLEKSRKSSKNKQTALKVQLMRLKGKAVGQGNIPAAERIYFLLHPPRRTNAKSKAIYVCKEWSVGRVIDSAASLCDVPNRNNEAHSAKLRLFRKSDGLQISSDMGCKLGLLVDSGDINNGESIILEYVDPGDSLTSFSIDNFDSYVE